jgi:hypothetical protein
MLCYLNDSPTVLNRITTPFRQWSTHTDQLSNVALPQTDLPSSRRLQIPYTVNKQNKYQIVSIGPFCSTGAIRRTIVTIQINFFPILPPP